MKKKRQKYIDRKGVRKKVKGREEKKKRGKVKIGM